MFESICIRHQQIPYIQGSELDIGFLAESLVFYQNVEIIVDQSGLKSLLVPPGPGPTHLMKLIKEGYLRVSYLEKILGIRTYKDGGLLGEQYLPISIKESNGNWSLERVAPKLFSRYSSGPGHGRHLGREFARLVSTIDIPINLFDQFHEDFSDKQYVRDAAIRIIKAISPDFSFPDNFEFYIFKDRDKYGVNTNVDFETLKVANLSNEQWGVGHVLVHLLTARADLFFAAQKSSDLSSDFLTTRIIELKWEEILQRSLKYESDVTAFQTMVANNAHEIGDSIVNGYRTWGELIELLDKAKKFKEMLKDKPDSSALLYEYNKALAKDTWIDSLPMKILRFLAFTGLEMLLPLPISTAISAADTFLVDKVFHGWKPDQFVNGPLKKDFLKID